MQPSPRLESISSQTQAAQPSTEITIKLTPFDRKEYRALIEARDQTLRRIVKRLKPALGLSNAVDAGCGVGFFSQTLAECGLCTCGFDARAQNIEAPVPSAGSEMARPAAKQSISMRQP